MAEVSRVEWFNTLVGKQVFSHNTKDCRLDNDKKQPEAESQIMLEKNKEIMKNLLFVKEECSLAATPFRPIRQNRSKVKSYVENGMAGGLLLAQLQVVLPVLLDETPSSTLSDKELVSRGIPAASVKQYRVFNDLMRERNYNSEHRPFDTSESDTSLPPTASSIAGLRGLQMMQLQLKKFVGDSPMNDGAELLGDPAEDEEWLEIMQKVFGETGTLLSKNLDHLFLPPRSLEAKLACRLDKKRQTSPLSSEVEEGPPSAKKKKTHRASQQQIGTLNSRDRSCPLAKELARLDELDRQQPPPSSRKK